MQRFKTFLGLVFLAVLFSANLEAQETSDSSPVSIHGALSVSGTKIVDQNNNVVSFAGNSFFWSNTYWGAEEFYNPNVVSWLKEDWGSTIVRLAMGVDEVNGYLDRPQENMDRLTTVVDAAIANGMYVVIDWHSHNAEFYRPQAIAFFQQMARKYGENPHVIYEIYNEPVHVSWSNTVKPYAEAVIAAIREIDPDNLIIVGSPTWSQDVDVASLDPIRGFDNIAYTLHFYAATHGESLRQKAQTAIDNGLALFVTEWGTVEASADGEVDHVETDRWMNFLEANDISHCNWSITDKDEGASVVVPGTNPNGGWSFSDLTISGIKAKEIIESWPKYDVQESSGSLAYPNGVAHAIPGVVSAVNYDTGGAGVSYFDTSPGNSGAGDRQDEDVDTSGPVLGWLADGEWVEYTVNVETAGRYQINCDVSSVYRGGKFRLEFGGEDVTGTITVPKTGSWTSYRSLARDADLKSGVQKLRIFIERGRFNITNIHFRLKEAFSENADSQVATEEAAVEQSGEAEFVPVNVTSHHDGVGKFRWAVSGTVFHVLSWNADSVIINGVDCTNRFLQPRSESVTDSPLVPIDGMYFIEVESTNPNGHFEIVGKNP